MTLKFYKTSDGYWVLQELDDLRVLENFDLDFIRILQEINTDFFWNSLRVSIRILKVSISIQQFRWLWNSSRVTVISIRILIFSIKPIYDTINYVWKFFWNSPRNLIRIPLASPNIQQFIWLLSSSRIRWPWNFCEILAGFDHNFTKNLYQNFH